MNCCCCCDCTSLKTGIYYGFFADALRSKDEQITQDFANYLAEKRAEGRKIIVFVVYPTQPEEATKRLQDLGLDQYVDEVRAVKDNDYAKYLGDMDEVYSMEGFKDLNEAIDSARSQRGMLSQDTRKLFTDHVVYKVGEDFYKVRIFGEDSRPPLPQIQ